jgi:hypothetical protein
MTPTRMLCSSRARIFALTLLTPACATSCAQTNPLLGHWVLSSGPSGCNTQITFTAHHQDFTWRGSTSGAPVTGYVVQPGRVIVGGSPGVIETFTYVVVDANTISQPTSSTPCVWKRQ